MTHRLSAQLDGHKLWWHLDRVHQWQNGETVAPLYIEISPVSYCNHHCLFCALDFAQKPGTTLDSERLCTLLPQMREAGLRSIMYAGEGEPLLHPDLGRMVRDTRSNGIDAAITTNGTQGDRDMWNDLLGDLTWVRFSVDAGSPAVYGKVHGVPDTWFERVTASIHEAVEVKHHGDMKTTIGVQYLVLEENLSDLPTAMRLFDEIGVDYFAIKPHSLHPKTQKPKDVRYTETRVRNITASVREFETESSGMQVVFRERAFSTAISGHIPFEHCYALPFWGYISSQGDFYSCSVHLGDPEFLCGNICVESYSDIIHGERRAMSIAHGRGTLRTDQDCRLNCRMVQVNESLQSLAVQPDHVNFI